MARTVTKLKEFVCAKANGQVLIAPRKCAQELQSVVVQNVVFVTWHRRNASALAGIQVMAAQSSSVNLSVHQMASVILSPGSVSAKATTSATHVQGKDARMTAVASMAHVMRTEVCAHASILGEAKIVQLACARRTAVAMEPVTQQLPNVRVRLDGKARIAATKSVQLRTALAMGSVIHRREFATAIASIMVACVRKRPAPTSALVMESVMSTLASACAIICGVVPVVQAQSVQLLQSLERYAISKVHANLMASASATKGLNRLIVGIVPAKTSAQGMEHAIQQLATATATTVGVTQAATPGSAPSSALERVHVI